MSSAVIRLYEIMLQTQKIKHEDGYITGWTKIFGAKNREDAWRKVGRLHELVESAAVEAMEISPSEEKNIRYWKEQISSALWASHKNSHWGQFATYIDQHTLGYLSSQATICRFKINHPKIDIEKIKEASNLLNEAIKEISQSDLDSKIKLNLIRHIRLLSNALDDYVITGDEEIFDHFLVTALNISNAIEDEIAVPSQLKLREGLSIVSELVSAMDDATSLLSGPIKSLLSGPIRKFLEYIP